MSSMKRRILMLMMMMARRFRTRTCISLKFSKALGIHLHTKAETKDTPKARPPEHQRSVIAFSCLASSIMVYTFHPRSSALQPVMMSSIQRPQRLSNPSSSSSKHIATFPASIQTYRPLLALPHMQQRLQAAKHQEHCIHHHCCEYRSGDRFAVGRVLYRADHCVMLCLLGGEGIGSAFESYAPSNGNAED